MSDTAINVGAVASLSPDKAARIIQRVWRLARRSKSLRVGMHVKAKYRGRGTRYFEGRISAVGPNDTYDIEYDDGDREKGAKRENIQICHEEGQRPMMRSVYVPPTRVRSSSVDTHASNDTYTRYRRQQAAAIAVAQPLLANRMTFREVSNILNTSYNYEQSIQSTTLDIIAVYLKGQKVLYTEAKTYCEMNLYMLMLPTIAISALCTLLSTELKGTAYGATVVASMAAVNSFLLTLVTYLKLDAKAEAHKTSAYCFEKLQARCEFTSGKVLFLTNTPTSPDAQAGGGLQPTTSPINSFNRRDLPQQQQQPQASNDQLFSPKEVLREIESKIMEIKDTNSFILPEAIRYNFPVLTSTNIFTEVKRLQNKEIILINELKVIINKQQEIDHKLQLTSRADEHSLLVGKQDELSRLQNNVFDKVIAYRDEYLQIDRKFQEEVQRNIRHWSNAWCTCFRWLKT